jgi:hypothetical protein
MYFFLIPRIPNGFFKLGHPEPAPFIFLDKILGKFFAFFEYLKELLGLGAEPGSSSVWTFAAIATAALVVGYVAGRMRS